MNTDTLLDRAYRHLSRRLCRAVPPAPTDEERADRDKAAIAQVAALQAANTAAFKLAAQFVASSERAQYCLTLADGPDLPPALALQWTGRSDLMMRQANSALRSLLRLQAERRKIEADPKAYSRGERIEDHMTVIMAEAVANPPLISPDDPESHTDVSPLPRAGESLPPTGSGVGSRSDPGEGPVSSLDLESHMKKIEILPRHPSPHPFAGNSPPRPQAGGDARRATNERPVSHHDPESHTKKLRLPRDSSPPKPDGAQTI